MAKAEGIEDRLQLPHQPEMKRASSDADCPPQFLKHLHSNFILKQDKYYHMRGLTTHCFSV